MQTTSNSPKSTDLRNQKIIIKYMYDWDNETKYYERRRIYHLEMADHFQILGDHLKSDPYLGIV
jgi:hypothetical protein